MPKIVTDKEAARLRMDGTSSSTSISSLLFNAGDGLGRGATHAQNMIAANVRTFQPMVSAPLFDWEDEDLNIVALPNLNAYVMRCIESISMQYVRIGEGLSKSLQETGGEPLSGGCMALLIWTPETDKEGLSINQQNQKALKEAISSYLLVMGIDYGNALEQARSQRVGPTKEEDGEFVDIGNVHYSLIDLLLARTLTQARLDATTATSYYRRIMSVLHPDRATTDVVAAWAKQAGTNVDSLEAYLKDLRRVATLARETRRVEFLHYVLSICYRLKSMTEEDAVNKEEVTNTEALHWDRDSLLKLYGAVFRQHHALKALSSEIGSSAKPVSPQSVIGYFIRMKDREAKARGIQLVST